MNKWYETIMIARKEKRLTGKAFAEMVGITPVYMCNIEKGKKIPSMQVLKKICTILDLNFFKIAKEVGYSQGIEKIKNDLYSRADIEKIVFKLCDMTDQDFSLVVDLVKQLSNLTEKEKDIIKIIISSYAENSSG